MAKRAILTCVAVSFIATLGACNRAVWHSSPATVFFPLKPHTMWMYQVESKSQRANYTVTDMVIGSQYVPALKLTGNVVQEFYNLDRAGLRPLVYTLKNGYFTRLSGLDYVEHQIKGPTWGRSEEPMFLPERLAPDQSWSNNLFPYGKMPGSFRVAQIHRTFFETGDVTVPAGKFTGCIRIETAARYQGGPYEREKQDLRLAYKDWYAPNVGLIRTIAYEGGPKGPEMERVELLRFEPGSKAATAQVTVNNSPKS